MGQIRPVGNDRSTSRQGALVRCAARLCNSFFTSTLAHKLQKGLIASEGVRYALASVPQIISHLEHVHAAEWRPLTSGTKMRGLRLFAGILGDSFQPDLGLW